MTAPKPKLRWFQFSLRTLLVVVTLCAIPRSWLGVKLRQAKREREAAAALEKAGAMLDWSKPSGPRWLRSLLGNDLFTHVESADFLRTQATDADLGNLRTLNQLRELSVDNGVISDAGLEHLEGLKQLQELSLTSCQITDAGLEHLRGLNQLQELSLGCDLRCTRPGVKKLQKALPTWKIHY